MTGDDVKRFCRKLWWFLWEDNSIWSWLANIVIAFVLIKFVIYPGLGFLLGTGYPIVAVVSSSMEHDGSFDEWWSRAECCVDASCSKRSTQGELYQQQGISGETFQQFPFRHGFDKGDIMILTAPKELAIGDILVFWADARKEPIIHRIVQTRGTQDSRVYKTKGDHNCGSAAFEQGIGQDRIIGKAAVRIPLLGWIKIVFAEILRVVGVLA
jgi:signal peptidase I